ncbi:MAG: NAD(P)H-dependent oxidoreductase [Desulfobacteraceae bacterium]|nr:NAD(P)H-dependent oxidoreductase [Desulfobacteraceae bacterium]
MRLTVFNGSPRGRKSTTKILLEHFINGFMTTDGNTYEMAYLNRVKDKDKFIKAFQEAEQVLLAFPLYCDAIPAMVKTFIESLEPLCDRVDNLSIGFLVQSGFPEAIHSRYVERYLEKLTRRLGCRYMGTVIKGNANRIQEQPGWMTKKVFKSFYELGKTFGETGEFDEQIVLKLAKPEKLPVFQQWIFRLMLKTPLASYNWNKMLKENNAFEKRFAKPYAS